MTSKILATIVCFVALALAPERGELAEPSTQLSTADSALKLTTLGVAIRPGTPTCVVAIGAQSPCHESLDAVFAAWPNLASMARKSDAGTHELAQVVHALTNTRARNSSRVTVDARLVTSAEQAKSTFRRWIGVAPDLDALETWRADTVSEIPNIDTLLLPHWNGSRLVATALFLERGREEIVPNQPQTRSYLSIRAARFEVDLANGPGAYKFEVLPSKRNALDAHGKAVAKLFGGPVDAFVQVPFDKHRRLIVAIGPKSSASRFVVRTGDQISAYASWEKLAGAHPAVAEPATLATLFEHVFWFYTYRTFNDRPYPIKDAAAYKRTYRERGWHEEKLRYWHDEFRHTVWEVPELETVSDPRVDKGVLIVFGKEQEEIGREPRRYEVDLEQLELSSVVRVTHLWKTTVLEDTGASPQDSGPLTPQTPTKRIR